MVSQLRFALLLLCLGCAAAIAQSHGSHNPPLNAESPPTSLAVRQPVIDPAIELHGMALVTRLRLGGYVLFMRHAANGPGNAAAGNPCPNGESPLTPEGQLQAKAVGLAIEKLGIRIAKVLSSATCRARMTAELVVGAQVELSTDLSPLNPAEPKDGVALRQALFNTAPQAGTNTLLVSHFHGAPNPKDRLFLDLAEIIVFSPQSAGNALAVARVPHALWTELLRTNE